MFLGDKGVELFFFSGDIFEGRQAKKILQQELI